MQLIRTLIWIVATVVLVAFIAMNWNRVPVNFWPLEATYMYVEWPVGIIALVFFALGALPVWLYHRAAKWRWQRRVASLENSVRATTIAPPIATSTQLEAAPHPTEEPTA